MILKYTFGYILITMMIFMNVASWTIDLPEVRRYLFEKREQEKIDYVLKEKTFFDNVNPDSAHHLNSGLENRLNVEKEVMNLIHDGSAYLEGLRRSVERYIEYLENCTSKHNTTINLALNSTWLPQNELPDLTNFTLPIPNNGNVNMSTVKQNATGYGNEMKIGSGTWKLCENISRSSEYVRRVAQLAVWTTKRLQDLVYAEEYQHDNGKEEDELIFKLAWFLDQLAKMTGYVPDPKMFMGEEPRETTTSIPYPVPPMPDFSIPEDVKKFMMNCIKMDSPIPATVRCAFPLPLPPGVAELFNLTDTASTSLPSTVTERVLPLDSIPGQSSLELLTAAETFTPLLNTHGLRASENVPKRVPNRLNTVAPLPRELSDLTPVQTVTKRSINENPLINLMKYYVKHSSWVNSNPMGNLQSKLTSNGDDKFDVTNHLTDAKPIQKRSVVYRANNQIRIPDIPMPNLSRYVKNKPGIRYLRDHLILDKIKNILERMHKHKLMNANNKLPKPFPRVIKKRSLKYERMYLPRESENPMQDISYYVKNKEGTEYNPSLLQAAQARAALEAHFQTGNILIVRQYGSNYNPLVPVPFYAGVLRSMADS